MTAGARPSPGPGRIRAWDALPADLRAALASGATVVTPNKRLAHRLAALYDAAQRAAGQAVWASPAIVPWSGWLERLWLDAIAADAGADPPRLIAPASVAYLWGRVVAAEALPLIDVRGAAILAADAWSLVHAWGTGGPSWRAWAGGDDDCAAFARWAEAYAASLARFNGLDRAQLSDWLARRAPGIPAWRDAAVVLAGFVEIAPQQERLLAAADAAGMRIARASTTYEGAPRTWRAVGATPRDEVVRALRWARERALADPCTIVGIAIEDLAARRDEVHALAEEILCPALQWPGQEDVPRPYNLSLGSPACEVPLIATALDLIAFAHAALPAARAAALLRSPYVAPTRDDWLARAGLEARWLTEGWRDLALDEALGALDAVDPAFAAHWRAARERQRMPPRASPREWTVVWRTWLAATGWPGERALSSAEWQARGVWDELLGEFAALTPVAKSLSRADAVAALGALANDHVFQPEAAPAPVQILGILEAAGLPLDGLWVAGLAAECWPPAPEPNPLLALAWQRERHVPHATAARELAYTEALTAQLSAGADEVVFSYALRADDHARSASALMPAAAPLPDGATSPPPTAGAQVALAPAPDILADDRAPALPVDIAVAGGAGLIEAQSDCPFRAVAAYRLKAQPWPAPLDGLSAPERGSLVHAALAAFWRDVGDHRTLVALSPDALAKRIDTVVRAAASVVPAARWRTLPAVVQAGEAARLAAILRAWLDGHERARPPFAVAEIEASRRLALGGLGLALRLDRIDALADGGIAIIDYKTGAAKPPATWFDARPQAPQIGLYVLAENAADPPRPVRAAAYAQLKPGAIRIQGIAADANAWPGLPGPARVREAALADWPAVEARWRELLGALACGFREGRAEVAPRTLRTTCARCGLQALCRIGALSVDETPDSGGE